MRVGLINNREFFVFSYGDGVRFVVSRRGTEVWADWPDGYHLEDACTYLYGPVLGFVLRLRGVICLHASAVAIGDYAIAFAGLPGTGKSTTAAAFAQSGFPVLSDDVVALCDKGHLFLVQPGYPRVNLWPDSVCALFGTADALPSITPTWDKRYLAVDRHGYSFASSPMPLRAIYILEPRGPRGPVIQSLSSSESLISLVAQTYMNYMLNREMRSREFDLLSRLAAILPVQRVFPQANPSAIAILREAILSHAANSYPAEAPAGVPQP